MLHFLLALLACGPAADAWDVSYKPAGDADVDSVKEALDELYVKCRTRDVADETRSPLGSDAENLALRVQVLELKVQQLETEGLYDAGHITYDPRRTALSSTSVQDALTELENRVTKVAEASATPGVAGEGLFEIPEDNGAAPGGPPGSGGPGGKGGKAPPRDRGKAGGGQGGAPGGGEGGPPGGGSPPSQAP